MNRTRDAIRTNPKPQQQWAVYNWGILLDTYRKRSDALAWCREEVKHYPIGGKVQDWREMFEIHKVMVVKHE